MPTSLVNILRWRAKDQPSRLAYRFLKDGEKEEECISYKGLDQRARSVGALLQASAKPGERVLLLLPPGLDFITAYLGCLYANVIAIPVSYPHPARLEKTLSATLRIAQDATPAIGLVNTSLLEAILAKREIRDQLSGMKLLAADRNDLQDWSEQWRSPAIDENDLAFLQYTSGSTTTPKGVMVSHGNLLHNLGHIEKSFGQTSESHAVIWLPPYHDMGLIGGILQPLYTGNPATLMPPMLFLQRPLRWLQAITRYRATTSGGPNFAFDLCVKKIKPEQKDQLDLSSLTVAFNGAEPIYHKTLDQFADYFASCGFRRKAFTPCYGLAEATLMVTGGPIGRVPVVKTLVRSEVEKNRVVISTDSDQDKITVVGCGQNRSGQKIRAVDVDTLAPCGPGQIGEIWVSGPSVAKGYWNNPTATTATFHTESPDTREEHFLRTGDLGFMLEGELFITGRLKNLIIIDGKNHYPHDIERTVVQSHPAIRPGGCAVFPVERGGTERVIVVTEVQRTLLEDKEGILKVIRRAVATQHELSIHDIQLTLPGSIPRTTSGKIKHFLCRNFFLSGTFKEILTP